MIRVVLDTNALVSASIKDTGAEASVLDLIITRHLMLFVSEPILEEYEAVLLRPKFHLDPDLIENLMRLILSVSTIVKPARTLSISSDEDDNRFLECAEKAQADYLITGNKRHFPKSWRKTNIKSVA